MHLSMFSIKLSEDLTKNIQEAVVYTTSENNSYGAVFASWYDGKVNPIQLQRGEYSTIVTTKMTRYEYLDKKCIPTSFYGCLGEKLRQQRTCQINGTQCLPISTPIKEMPICPTDNPWFCEQATLQAQQECVGLLPCITEEYTVVVDDQWSSKEYSTKELMKTFLVDKVVEQLLEGQHGKYYFWIELTGDKQKPNGYPPLRRRQFQRERS